MPGLLLSPAREALKEVRRLEGRLERLEAEMVDLREALHAHANAVNAALLRLEREWRKGKGD
jgi:predicted  nucleic acid-binding Zn-ribbon protein